MQFTDYWRIFRKRWWLPLLVAVVAAAVAYGYSKLQNPLYRAEATITAQPAKVDTNQQAFLTTQLNLYKQTMQSTDFANEVNTAGKFDMLPDTILTEMVVQPLPSDGIVKVDVSDHDNQRARILADTIANVFVRDRDMENETLQLSPDNRIDYGAYPASLPTQPVSPNTRLNIGAGAAIGLVLGLVLIFVLEFFDDRFDTADDVRRTLALPTLGQIPPAAAPRPNSRPPAPAFTADAGKPPLG